MLLVCASFPCLAVHAFGSDTQPGQKPPSIDHAVVVEIGAAGEWEIEEDSRHFGGTVAVEVTPIENVLELECGVTVLDADEGLETSMDVLFKKPYRLSPRVEFMIGLGPEIAHASGKESGGTFVGAEAVLDFMFWPGDKVGWYLEPGYGLLFRNGTQHGAGMTAGVLIGW